MKMRMSFVVAMLVFMLVLTSFAQTGLEGKREIIWGYIRDIANLDPAHLPGSPNYQFAMNIFNGLVRYKSDQIDVEPSLATSWDLSEDGKVYTFHLRDDVFFHKGYGQLTSDDVKFSFDRILDPEEGSRYAGLLSSIEKVVAIDDLTVEVHLKAPEPAFLVSAFAFRPGYIVSRRAVEELGADFSTNPIGTGPYIFDSWTTGQEVVLVSNEDYWNGAPYFKKVTMKVIPEETVSSLALQKDEINYLMVREVETQLELMSAPNIAMIVVPGTQLVPLWMNTSREPLNDVRVRRAIAHAIDLEEFTDAVLEGTGFTTHSVIPPPMIGYTDDVVKYPLDLEKARQLLTDAGYPGGGFELELVYRATGIKPAVATILQSMLARIGIQVILTVVETGEYTERRKAGDTDLNIELLSRFEPNQILTELLHSSSFPPGGNISYYDGADDLIDQQSVETDPERRRELLQQIQKQIAEDIPGYMLSIKPLVSAFQDYIKGHPDNTGHWMARFDLMYAED